MRQQWLILLLVLFVAILPDLNSCAWAASARLLPGVSQSMVDAALAALLPGDTLTVSYGTYTGIDLALSGVSGTMAQPISIVGELSATGERPLLVADTDSFQENIHLKSGCAFISISGLHLQHTGANAQVHLQCR